MKSYKQLTLSKMQIFVYLNKNKIKIKIKLFDRDNCKINNKTIFIIECIY